MIDQDRHPDDLLDHAQRRRLSPTEQAQLDSHLARCSLCAFERGLAHDHAAPEPGDDDRLARLVDLAMDQLTFVQPASSAAHLQVVPPPSPSIAPPPAAPVLALRSARPARPVRVWFLIAAAMTLFALTAAAATVWVVRRPRPQPAPQRPAPPAAHAHLPAPEPTPEPAVVAPALGAAARPAATPRRSTAGGNHSHVVGSADELFSQANAARQRRAYSDAERYYTELQDRFPTSREAALSRVTMGRLLLDRHQDPHRALDLFETYLRQQRRGEVAEQAMVGRAVAQMRLGHAAAERAAWQALLSAFPDSIHAGQARSRLAALP